MGLPLLLGSEGLAFSQLFIFGVAWPAVRGGMSVAGLTGYGDYAASVRYRFIPFVW
jgi:hypothetical protein